jgi:hypothetical protein
LQEWNGCGIGIGTLVTSCRRSSSSSARCALRARVTSCPCSAIHVPFCVFIIIIVPSNTKKNASAFVGCRCRVLLRGSACGSGLSGHVSGLRGFSSARASRPHYPHAVCSRRSRSARRSTIRSRGLGPLASGLWVPPRKCPLSLSLVSRSLRRAEDKVRKS